MNYARDASPQKKGDDLFINSKNVLAYGAQSSFYQYLRKSTNNRTIAETSALNNGLLVASTFHCLSG